MSIINLEELYMKEKLEALYEEFKREKELKYKNAQNGECAE